MKSYIIWGIETVIKQTKNKQNIHTGSRQFQDRSTTQTRPVECVG